MALIDLLLPPACAGCGRAGALLCDRCRGAFRPPSDPADRFVAADAGAVIGDALSLALSAFAYEGPLRRALAALKYSGASRLASPLADASVRRLEDLLAITGRATLVTVPVHVERRRSRGYDQAELIAARLAARAGLPMRSVLERVRPTTKQHGLNRVERLANLRDAFAVRTRAPPTAILVDDIVTTTATLEACATVLRTAGTETVYGFSVAREV
jgi:ComF family protein